MRGNRTSRPFAAQPRELHLLGEASVLRVFDREQAQTCAGFRSVARANTRLPKLVAHGLLKRFFLPTDKGGKKALYSMTRKGAALAHVSFAGLSRPSDRMLVGDLFVAHQMHINDIYLKLKYRPIPSGGVLFRRWTVLKVPLSTSSAIIPDGYFELTTPNRVVSCFLEVDLGGETSKIWKSKIEAYLNFAATGDFENQFQQPQFRVVIVTTSDRRVQALRTLAAKYTEKLFWISTFTAINRDSLWSPVWFRPTGDKAQSLL
jgi:hypothetical protein